MASFIYEEGTQLDASGFVSGDTLIFKTALPTDLGVTFTPASGLSADLVTLAFDGQSLTFTADGLHGGTENFLAGGQLSFGSGLNDSLTVGSVGNASASAGYGFSGADTITVQGDGAHFVYGGAGEDTIDASTSTGAVYLFGGADNDVITGGSGNDHIYGNALGTVQGAADGIDIITVGDGSNYVNGNAGDDTITAGSGSNRLYGGAGNDVIVAGLGSTGNNHINGNAGDDFISVGEGNNVVRGGQGNDDIYANSGGSSGLGTDVLMGDAGNDNLHAGSGLDVMTGGSGSDAFFIGGQFSSAPHVIDGSTYYNEITDFANGVDHIVIRPYLPDEILTQQAGVTFTSIDAAETYAQQLLSASSDNTAVAAITVGSDTVLFFNNMGTSTEITGVVKLDGFTDVTHLTHDDGATSSFWTNGAPHF